MLPNDVWVNIARFCSPKILSNLIKTHKIYLPDSVRVAYEIIKMANNYKIKNIYAAFKLYHSNIKDRPLLKKVIIGEACDMKQVIIDECPIELIDSLAPLVVFKVRSISKNNDPWTFLMKITNILGDVFEDSLVKYYIENTNHDERIIEFMSTKWISIALKHNPKNIEGITHYSLFDIKVLLGLSSDDYFQDGDRRFQLNVPIHTQEIGMILLDNIIDEITYEPLLHLSEGLIRKYYSFITTKYVRSKNYLKVLCEKVNEKDKSSYKFRIFDDKQIIESVDMWIENGFSIENCVNNTYKVFKHLYNKYNYKDFIDAVKSIVREKKFTDEHKTIIKNCYQTSQVRNIHLVLYYFNKDFVDFMLSLSGLNVIFSGANILVDYWIDSQFLVDPYVVSIIELLRFSNNPVRDAIQYDCVEYFEKNPFDITKRPKYLELISRRCAKYFAKNIFEQKYRPQVMISFYLSLELEKLDPSYSQLGCHCSQYKYLLISRTK